MADLATLKARLETLIAEKNSQQQAFNEYQQEERRLRRERAAAGFGTPNYDPTNPENIARENRINQLDTLVKNTAAEVDSLNSQINTAQARVTNAEADNASTRQNNSGTGEPGTAGEGTTATSNAEQRAAATPPPTVTTAQDPTQSAATDTEFGDLEGAIQKQKTVSNDEFGDLQGAIERQQGSEEVRAEDGSVSQGIRRNTETGEVYFTGPTGTTARQTKTQTEATNQDQVNFQQFDDWRVRLSLAPEAKYLYNSKPNAGILAPLVATNGILFPYTPNVQVTYQANYDPLEVVHSNYKMYQYRASAVENIQITCNFTAQDTFEANYLLAVIHFLRCVTKMFYGKDENPARGTPPPLCYLTGLGSFQFDAHPLAVTTFTYNLPDDVDYIRAGTTTTLAGVNKGPETAAIGSNPRLDPRIQPGANPSAPSFGNPPGGTVKPTYVPTKIQISINAIPIISRKDISTNFSLKDYANGTLLRGMSGNKRISGGIW